MKEILNFLIEVGKLRKRSWRGWAINQIKDPETIADHAFRVAIMGWVLAEKKGGLNIEKILKMALACNFCKIYAGDITPYDLVLPQIKKEQVFTSEFRKFRSEEQVFTSEFRKFRSEELKELMRTWPPRLSSVKKREIALKKYKKEAKALKKIILKLPLNLKKEIKNLWLDYEKGLTPEGKFLSQVDRMESFLQAYEYWEKYKSLSLEPWWTWAREFFDDPLLLELMERLNKVFHLKKSDALINFFINIGKLKRKKRRGWLIHQIKNPESTAEHIFRMAIIAWVLGKKKRLRLKRVIKMALIHDLCEVYTPDLTPYDPLLPKDQNKIMETLKHWPKFTLSLKIKSYKNKYKLESRGLNKLISKLPPNLKKEIKNLWLDYEKGLTKEGRFVKQVDKIGNLLQGIEYWKEEGKIQHRLWMRWIKEIIDDPILIEFIKTLEKKFIKDEKRR